MFVSLCTGISSFTLVSSLIGYKVYRNCYQPHCSIIKDRITSSVIFHTGCNIPVQLLHPDTISVATFPVQVGKKRAFIKRWSNH